MNIRLQKRTIEDVQASFFLDSSPKLRQCSPPVFDANLLKFLDQRKLAQEKDGNTWSQNQRFSDRRSFVVCFFYELFAFLESAMIQILVIFKWCFNINQMIDFCRSNKRCLS